MARYQVILAYDGADFDGFQRQKHRATRTVQGAVEAALFRLGWQGRTILAAGRTDAGVHASGQVIAFDLDWRHTTQDLQAALNAYFPPDVAAQAVHEVQPDFHPRYHALARTYRYTCFCAPQRNPLRERYAWRIWPPVDLERLQQAAAYLVGKHDFSAFGAPPRAGGGTTREVFHAEWFASSADVVFEISANAFLYHMVRRLVGFQTAIGQGKFAPQAILNCLQSGIPPAVKGMAPACGLTLASVHYPQPESNQVIESAS